MRSRPGLLLSSKNEYGVKTELCFSLSCAYDACMITAAQIRAARGLLKWTQGALAAKSGLSVVTLNMIESEAVQPRKGSLAAIRNALEAGGVEFIGAGGGIGVRFREGAAMAQGSGPNPFAKT
jgi:DNA-binding transcriptional regulator YiaG